jgi:hypothetical protein
MLEPIAAPPGSFVLDIGGEGRHPGAWNLNPRAAATVAGALGRPIPRLICGRGEAIPLPDHSVDLVIVERTPLWPLTLREIERVAKPGAIAILRHAVGPLGDPHARVLALLGRAGRSREVRLGSLRIRETVVHFQDRSRLDLAAAPNREKSRKTIDSLAAARYS